LIGTAAAKEQVVLLVEDDEATAELERRALARSGLRSRTVSRVSEAVALLREESFLAVVLDYQLPDGDPWPVVEAAKARVPRIPVILATGMGNERVAAEAIHHGVAEYVKKAATFQDRLPDIINRVSRHAQVEDELHRSNAFFQLIADNTSDLIVIADLNGIIKYCSPSCRTLYGYEPEEMVGARGLDFVHAADRARLADLFARLPEDKHFTATYRRQRKDGDYLWVEATVNALRDSMSGKVTEMVAIVRDMSERKRTEDSVRQNEIRYRTLFEESPISLWEEDFSAVRLYCDELAASGVDNLVAHFRANPDAVRQAAARIRVLRVNEATLRMYEADTQGQLLQRLQETLDEECIGAFREELCTFLAGFSTFQAEITTRTLTGRKRAGSIRVTILPGYESTWGRVVVSVFDITARLEAERRIRESLKEKETLLKEIHHRVKNNLQIVSSLLSLQVRHLTDPDALELYDEYERRIRSIALVHEQLYRSNDLSHISFREYVEELLAGLFQTFKAGERNIVSHIDIRGARLSIDVAIPCGLLINELVTNSLKHAFPNGRSGEIRVTMISGEKRPWRLVVADDGIGLPQDIDLENTDSLGLELISAIARQLQVKVGVIRNNGTTFEFRFAAT
jgi:PAS domain S-box-containing protein